MQKRVILIFVVLAILTSQTAYAKTPYVILTPSGSSSSYSAGFNQTAVLINSSLANSSKIIYFDDSDIASANASVAPLEPDYVFLVVQPQNATPQFLDEVGDMLKTLDSDPFVDAAWGIITGKDNTTAWQLYNDRNMAWSKKRYFAVPYGDLAANNANAVLARLTTAEKASSIGSAATSSNIYSNANLPPSLFYYSTNTSEYNQFSSYDNSKCFYANTTGLWCDPVGEIIAISNALFVSDTPESGRIQGTPDSSQWYLGKNTAAQNNLSFPIKLVSVNVSGVLAPYSTTWATYQMMTKTVMNEFLSANAVGDALMTAKNLLLMNIEKEPSIQDKTFIENLERQYVLYGKPTLSGDSKTGIYTLNTPAAKIYGASHEVGKNLTWDMSIEITPTALGPIYTNSWQQSNGVVWYKNITTKDAQNSTNITIAAAATGIAYLDESVLNSTLLNQSSYPANITVLTLNINTTHTEHLSNTTSEMNTTLVSVDGRRIYFSILYSPNATLSTAKKTIDFVITTQAITQNTTSITTDLPNTTAVIEIKNPTPWSVPNVSVVYEVPPNVTTGCTVTGTSAGACNLTTNNTQRFANFTITSLPSQTSTYTLKYTTTITANESVSNPEGAINDRGDIIMYNASIASTQNSTLADVNFTLFGPGGEVIFVNETSGKSINSSNAFIFRTNWTVPSNATPGQYYFELTAKDSGSEREMYENRTYFDITDSIDFFANGTIGAITISHTNHSEGESWYFLGDDYVDFSGYVYNKNNKSAFPGNITANITGIGGENTTTTDSDGRYSLHFAWTGVPLGTKNMTIIAKDVYNNTATYMQQIHITNYAARTEVSLDRGDHVYEYGKEAANLTVKVYTSGSDPVYDADVTISASGIPTTTLQTDTTGTAIFTITLPQETYRQITISSVSRLNKTKTIANSSEYYATWLSYENVLVTPANPKVGQDITISGNVYTKGNKSTCSSGYINIKVFDGAYSRNSTVSVTDNEFSNTFVYTSSNSHPTKVNFQASDWIYVFDGNLTNCMFYGRTLNPLSYDVQPSGNYFTVTSNGSSTTDSGTTIDPLTGEPISTESSETATSCTKDTECSSGDYCSAGACKAITCKDGVIVDHECVSAYKLTISDYPAIFYIEQGKTKELGYKIKNTGYKKVTGLKAGFVAPSDLEWTVNYTSGDIPGTLSVDDESRSTAKITIPENLTIKEYAISIKAESKEKTEEASFVLQVIPGDNEKRAINSSMNTLGLEISSMKKDLEVLIKKLNNSNTNLAKTKLEEIETLYSEANEAISSEDYLSAYNKKEEIAALITQVRVILDDNNEILAASNKTKNIIITAILLVVIVAGGFYYIWVPAPGYDPKSNTYVFNPQSPPKNSFLKQLASNVSDVVQDYMNQKQEDEMKQPNYDFHKKKRWSVS